MNDSELLREQVSWEIRRARHDPDGDEVEECIRMGYETAANLLDIEAAPDAAPGIRAVLSELAAELRRQLPCPASTPQCDTRSRTPRQVRSRRDSAGDECRSVAEHRCWLLDHGWFISDGLGWCWRCNELILPGQAIRYEVDQQAGSVRGECCASITTPFDAPMDSDTGVAK